MKQFIKGIVAAIALAVGLGAFAPAVNAADTYDSYKDRPVERSATILRESSPVIWTGFWLGAGLGYGNQLQDVNFDVSDGEGGGFNLINLNGLGGSGVIYDVSLGYDANLGFAGLVAGIEGGLMGSNITTEASAFNGELKAEYGLGTVYWAAARVGRKFANDQVLAYVKGGYAWNDPEDLTFTGGSVALSDREGWLIGGGLEAHLTSGMFAYVEYTHIDFDETTVASGEGFTVREDTDLDLGKVGVKWKIGTGNSTGLLD